MVATPSNSKKAAASIPPQEDEELSLGVYSEEPDAYQPEDDEEDVRAGSNVPTFSWYNRMPDAEDPEKTHTGWHAPQGVWPGAFEDTMEEMHRAGKVELVNITHGEDTRKAYWHLARPRVFVLSKGLPPAWKMTRHPEENVGVVYAWPYDKTAEKAISTYRFQAIVVNLLHFGYDQPVVFQCRRTWTIDMENCLKRHQRAIDAANMLLNKERKAQGKEPIKVFFRHLALDLVQGARPEMRGKGQQKKPCYPIVDLVPERDVTLEYIQPRFAGKLRPLIDSYLPAAIEWSRDLGKRLNAQSEGAKDGDYARNDEGAQPATLRVNDDDNPFSDDDFPEDPSSSEEENGETLKLATTVQRQELSSLASSLNRTGKAATMREIQRLLSNRALTYAEAQSAIALYKKEVAAGVRK